MGRGHHQLRADGSGRFSRTASSLRSDPARAFTLVDADALDHALGAWMWTRTATVAGRRVIAIDGQTVRGARGQDYTAPHLVAAFDHATGPVLDQLQIGVKSNEIPAVRDLLDQFDLTDTIVTIDAMHTQRATASHIVAAGGAYVMTIKKNQPRLHRRAKAMPWAKISGSTSTETGHGRRVTRTIKTYQLTEGQAGFPHAAQVAQIRRTRTVKGTKTVEVVYLLCSLGAPGSTRAVTGAMGPVALGN